MIIQLHAHQISQLFPLTSPSSDLCINVKFWHGRMTLNILDKSCA